MCLKVIVLFKEVNLNPKEKYPTLSCLTPSSLAHQTSLLNLTLTEGGPEELPGMWELVSAKTKAIGSQESWAYSLFYLHPGACSLLSGGSLP
jgi:hypothetical protein